MCFSYIVVVYHGPLWFYLVHSVHFGYIRSIISTLILFGPLGVTQSTLVLLSLFWSHSVQSGPVWSHLVLLFHSVHFGLIQSTLVLFGPLWSNSDYFGLFQSTLVLFCQFCLFWSN